jgi:hypothetical protein
MFSGKACRQSGRIVCDHEIAASQQAGEARSRQVPDVAPIVENEELCLRWPLNR